MNKPKLGDVLEEYIIKGLHPFTQIDGSHYPANHCMMEHGADRDGDTVRSGKTWHMMNTCPDVRLLIPPHANTKDVVALLRKIADWIERQPDTLDWPTVAEVAEEVPF